MAVKTLTECETCNGCGFVRLAIIPSKRVEPCPRCNPDSGYEPGAYEAELVKKHGRCGNARGGGGRTCYRYKGHPGTVHYFQCGR